MYTTISIRETEGRDQNTLSKAIICRKLYMQTFHYRNQGFVEKDLEQISLIHFQLSGLVEQLLHLEHYAEK